MRVNESHQHQRRFSLAGQTNAHKTNTKEQFAEALKGHADWFEGDIRKELHGSRVEMRHDTGAESGDNLTLKEWLAKGKASGRKLKLDVKDSAELPEIIKEAKASGIPSHRLMFNLGDGELKQYGAKIRKDFPNAVIAINTHESGGEKMDGAEVKRMLGFAKELGQPVAFVARYDRLTDDAIAKLKGHGAISVWNDTGHGSIKSGDVGGLVKGLRELGVDGVIDIRPTDTMWDKVGIGIDKAKNAAGEWVHDRFEGLKSLF
jgi:hypothetical protein